jgi:uncharacterized protein YidB (DUF937 family)
VGLLDELMTQVQSKLGASGTSVHPDLLSGITQLIGGAGGLAGLVQQFEQGGLGNIVQSWVGKGPNQPVSPTQLQQVLGGTQLQALAAKLGVSPEAVSQQLSQVLPHVVNHLTPDGTIPATDPLAGALGMLKKFL